SEMSLTSNYSLIHPFSLSCSHCFCTSCWLSHILESIYNRKLPASCLDPDCPCTLSVSAAAALLDSPSLDIYEKELIDVLTKEGKLLTCPLCSKMHFNSGSRTLTCSCGLEMCTHCSQEHHFPVGCDAFRQYITYIRKLGFSNSYSSHHIVYSISNCVRCPACKSIFQLGRSSTICNFMHCRCGVLFCYHCNQRYTEAHRHCKGGPNLKIDLTDVIEQKSCSLLAPSLLAFAVQTRMSFLERRKELRKRIAGLPTLRRIQGDRSIAKLFFVLELCYLNSRRCSTSKFLASKLRFSLETFFNRVHCDINTRILELEQLHESIDSWSK
ncbi:hypothetical protein PMAYCL1PPCAC_01069, partial [Pristionchus mayeri]